METETPLCRRSIDRHKSPPGAIKWAVAGDGIVQKNFFGGRGRFDRAFRGSAGFGGGSAVRFGRRLGRADRQPTVDLPRIGRENRGVVVERKTDAQVRLARSRRSHDDDKPFVTHRRNCRPLRNR